MTDPALPNEHATGIVLKEILRRAMHAIRAKRFGHESTAKSGYDGIMDDVFTDADTAAQEIYLRSLRECFPGVGIVAEEEELVIAGSEGNGHLYFTLDPLDGTKAFIRRQASGVSSMIALVDGKEVVSAYIGTIDTCEVFGYRPGSAQVWRITDLDVAELLENDPAPRKLENMRMLLRNRESSHSDFARKIFDRCEKLLTIDGSIGVWMARLWSGEVHAALMAPEYETPWDSTPIIGISKKLGYVFLRLSESGVWEEYEPTLPREVSRRDHETLIMHRNHLACLSEVG